MSGSERSLSARLYIQQQGSSTRQGSIPLALLGALAKMRQHVICFLHDQTVHTRNNILDQTTDQTSGGVRDEGEMRRPYAKGDRIRQK